MPNELEALPQAARDNLSDLKRRLREAVTNTAGVPELNRNHIAFASSRLEGATTRNAVLHELQLLRSQLPADNSNATLNDIRTQADTTASSMQDIDERAFSTIAGGTQTVTQGATDLYRNSPQWLRLPFLGAAVGGVGYAGVRGIQGLNWLANKVSFGFIPMGKWYGKTANWIMGAGTGVGLVGGLAVGAKDAYTGISRVIETNRQQNRTESRDETAFNIVRDTLVNGMTLTGGTQLFIPLVPTTTVASFTIEPKNASGTLLGSPITDRQSNTTVPVPSGTTQVTMKFRLVGGADQIREVTKTFA